MRHVLLTLSLIPLAANADDWPQWLGPNRDGLTAETNLLTEWPADGPQETWRFEQMRSWLLGPAVACGKLYILGSRDGTEELLALDAEFGVERWSFAIDGEYENGWGNGPRGTPTIDGDRIYALGANGTLVCLDRREEGALLWSVRMQDFGGEVPTWGYSESPLVDGEKVIVTPGGSKARSLRSTRRRQTALAVKGSDRRRAPTRRSSPQSLTVRSSTFSCCRTS